MTNIFRGNIIELNNDNYAMWEVKLDVLLIKEKLWNQISTEKPIDATTSTAWQKKDDKVRAIIRCLLKILSVFI